MSNTTPSDSGPRHPLVSVVIPAFNCERYIGRAVRSVLAQTYPAIECIVVDDGSTDATASVVAAFGDRVRLIRQPNGGASAARNTGIEAASGRYIAFLDSDDYWLATKLELQVGIMLVHPDLVLVSCDLSWLRQTVDPNAIDPSRPGLDPSAVALCDGLADLLADPYLGTPTVLVDTVLAKEIGGFDVSMRVGEDLDFYFRLCAGQRFARLRQCLVFCQLRPGSLTTRPGGYPSTLELLDRVRQRHQDADHRIKALIDLRRQAVYREWVEALIFRGRGRDARIVLARSRAEGDGIPKHTALYLKSMLAMPIRAVRRLRRKQVRVGHDVSQRCERTLN